MRLRNQSENYDQGIYAFSRELNVGAHYFLIIILPNIGLSTIKRRITGQSNQILSRYTSQTSRYLFKRHVLALKYYG